MLHLSYLILIFLNIGQYNFASEISQKIINENKVDHCQFKPNLKMAILSGPMTELMFFFELNHNPSWKYMLSLHHASRVFNGQFVEGGNFAAESEINKLKNLTLVVDETSNFKKIFRKHPKDIIWVNTLRNDPIQATENLLALAEHFISGCHLKKQQVRELIKNTQHKLQELDFRNSKNSKEKKNVVFFLGKFNQNLRFPELIYNLDGPIISLQKVFQGYPSKLSYLPPSEKILNQLKNPCFFGLTSDSDQNSVKNLQLTFEKMSENKINIYFPQLLIPGFSQLNFLDQFLTKYEQELIPCLNNSLGT